MIKLYAIVEKKDAGMAEILLENDLRDVINALQQATDANRSVVIDTANDIMTNFVNGNLELDDNF